MTRWTSSPQYDPWEDYPSRQTPRDADRFNAREQALASYAEALAAEVGFDAQQFGAKGDGTTGDTDALNAYFTAKAGQTALLPPGVYLADKTIQIPPGTKVVGNGAKILVSPSLSGDSFGITNTDYSAGQVLPVLEGLEVDGNRGARSAGAGSLIEFRGSPSALASRCRIKGCYLHGAPGPTVALQNVQRCGIGWNVIGDAGRDGVLMQANCRDSLVAKNVIYDCDDDHIGVHSGPESTGQSSGVAVLGNICNCDGSTAGHGISVNGLDRFLVAKNIVWRAYGAGIQATNHNAFELRHGAIEGNVVLDTGYVSGGNSEGYGIQFGIPALATDYYSATAIANVKDIGIRGNQVYGSLRDGIRLRSGAGLSAIKVIDNDATFNGAYGFVINGQSGLTVAFNDFRNNTSGAISGSKAAGDIYFANKGDIPAITGSRGGNAALASLLSALATAGVITDGTSA